MAVAVGVGVTLVQPAIMSSPIPITVVIVAIALFILNPLISRPFHRTGRTPRVNIPPALQYQAFRRFWLGTLASVGNSQIRFIATGWLIYNLTDSTLYLAYSGIATAIPTILLNLFGGVAADKIDKRLLLAATNAFNVGVTVPLASLLLFDVINEWHVLIYAFLGGMVWAVQGPANEALYPNLVKPNALNSAVALNSATWNGTQIVSPFIAGMVIAYAGMAACFYVTAVGFSIMVYVALSLRSVKLREVQGEDIAAFRAMLEGMKFIKQHTIFAFLIGMTFFFTFFGMSWIFIMPVFARDILEVGADGQGILLMFAGIGALLASLRMSTLESIRQRGLLVIGAGTLAGFSIAGFALTSEYVGSYYLAMAFTFSIGVFQAVFLNTCISSVQIMVPNEVRGRVMAFYTMNWSFISLGGAQVGAIANFIGAPFALAIGGFAVSAFALGPALSNRKVRHLGGLVDSVEAGATAVAV